MRSLLSRGVDALSRLLDRNERTAVLGDLAETGASPAESIRQLAGLIVRRYASDWTVAGPWVALLAGAVPFGIVLSFVSRWWSDLIAHDVRVYTTVWIPGYLDVPGARHDVMHAVWTAIARCASLAVWSWMLGVVVGRLSRRSSGLVGCAFVLILFVATWGTTDTVRHNAFGSLLPRMVWYGNVASLLVRVVFVLIPAMLGLEARRHPIRRPRASGLLVLAATLGLTLMTLGDVEGSLTFGRNVLPAPGPDRIFGTSDDVGPVGPWASVLMLWPAMYVSAQSLTRKHANR